MTASEKSTSGTAKPATRKKVATKEVVAAGKAASATKKEPKPKIGDSPSGVVKTRIQPSAPWPFPTRKRP